MEKALETICDNIKMLREKRKFSQEKLAELAKVHPQTIKRLEQKRGTPNWSTVQLIADALGVDSFQLARTLKEKK